MVHSFQSNQGIKRQPYYIEIMQLLSDPSLFLTGDYFSTRPLLWKIRREIDGGIEPVLIEKTHDENDLFLSAEAHRGFSPSADFFY
jgi:hypothetical protein